MNNVNFRVLVADDESAILDNYRSILGAEPQADHDGLKALDAELFSGDTPSDTPVDNNDGRQFEVQYCSQGSDAVDAVMSASELGKPFSVAFLDVRMPPGINGVEAARRIRAVDPNLHIVFVTGYSDTDPKQIARTVPPIDKMFYVNKPFQPAEIEQFASALGRKWEVEQELFDLNTELTLRCRDLEQANTALSKARAAAETSSKAKSAFMANMSHEFRTPLNAVVGFSDALLSGVQGELDDGVRGYIEDVNKAGLRLSKMVEDVFDVIQLQLNEITLTSTNLSIDQTIARMIGGISDDAASRKVEIKMDLKATGVSALLDEARFRKSIYHLLHNAISFCDAGQTVEVTSARLNNSATVKITDHGTGMTPEQLELALQPFSQIDETLTRRHEGLGLGLPVAKQLLEKMGIGFKITSEPGKGTTVELAFPTVV